MKQLVFGYPHQFIHRPTEMAATSYFTLRYNTNIAGCLHIIVVIPVCWLNRAGTDKLAFYIFVFLYLHITAHTAKVDLPYVTPLCWLNRAGDCLLYGSNLIT